MKKFLTSLIAITLVFSIHASVRAAIAVPWIATSTSPGFIQPNAVNGNIDAIKVPYIFATSTTATSTFNGNISIPTGSFDMENSNNGNYFTVWSDEAQFRGAGLGIGGANSSPHKLSVIGGNIYAPSGIEAYASSTIGNGTAKGGLTVNGTATTSILCLLTDCRSVWPTGGGSGVNSWATTTSTVPGHIVNYSLNNTDIVSVGSNSTTTSPFYFDPNTQAAYLRNFDFATSTNRRFVFEGDSITAFNGGAGTPNTWPEFLRRIDPYVGSGELIDAANAGDTMCNTTGSGSLGGIPSEYASEVYPYRPTKASDDVWLFLFAGTNDFQFATSTVAVYNCAIAYVNQARADGFRVVVMGMLPTSGNRELQRPGYNALLAGSANMYNYYIPTDTFLPNAGSTLYYSDGLHPTALGNNIIAQGVSNFVSHQSEANNATTTIPFSLYVPLPTVAIGTSSTMVDASHSTTTLNVSGYSIFGNGNRTNIFNSGGQYEGAVNIMDFGNQAGLSITNTVALKTFGLTVGDSGGVFNSGAFTIYDGQNNAQRLQIDTNGLTSIGMTTHTNQLDVNNKSGFGVGSHVTASYTGDVNVFDTGNNAGISLHHTGAGGGHWGIITSGNDSSGQLLPAGNLNFYDSVSNVSRMVLTPGGNIGMGTTTPWRMLSVNGSSDLGFNAYAGYFTATTSTASSFPYASTTMVSATTASTTNLIISGITGTQCLHATVGVVSGTGSDCGAGGGSAYPFSVATNATSTLTQFNGGLTAYASSTIGAGGVTTGLTVSGNLTTTGAIVQTGSATSTFAGPVLIGSATASTTLASDYAGHLITGGNVPTCGSNCTSIIGDDNTMRVVTGSSVSTATVNFATTWKNSRGTSITPACVAVEESAGTVAVNASSTPSTVVLEFASALTSVRIAVHCQASDNFLF